MSHTRKDLPTKIETTNIKNQGYIWQLEITPNQNSRQVQVKLMNPNPNKSLLNARALEIARKINLEHLPQVTNDFRNKSLNIDEEQIALTKYYYGKYVLFIKFPETVLYAVKPDFSQLQSLLEPFCDPKTNSEHNSAQRDDQKNITINAKFLVDIQGNIQKINYLPIINNKMRPILEPLLKRIRFYPRNENGIPKSFAIEQPIIIQCQ
ncbi:MAG: hypothetical protein RR569_07905 [Acinetobacter sp.]